MGIKELQRSFVGGEMSPQMSGRPDDLRFQHGATKLQNLIPLPQGPGQKRPGFKFVREIKDSANQARLMPFRFSQADTLMIEMGRATVSAREIGYFRFHTDGGTVLYAPVRSYIAPSNVTAISGDEFTTGTHDLTTGDPIVVTMQATGKAVTFTNGTNIVDWTTHGLVDGQQVLFTIDSGSLPAEIEENRLYYATNTQADVDEVTISETRGGNTLEFTDNGGATVWGAALPKGAEFEIDCRETYFAIVTAATTFKIAKTKEDALAGTEIAHTVVGTGDAQNDLKFHYDDRVGDLAEDSTGVLYCFRRPMTGESDVILTLGDHNSHAPSDVNFWVQVPGKQEDVSFDLANDEVDWTGHAQVVGETIIFSSTGALPTEITAGVTYYLRAVISANAFTISTTKGGALLTLSGSPSGQATAVAGSIYECPHFFDFTELLEVGYAQSKDVMTVVHRNRPGIELRRFGSTSWVVEEIPFNSALRPTDVTVVGTFGFGFEVSAFTAAAQCTISATHTLVVNDTVMALSLGDLADGVYSIIAKSGSDKVSLGELATQNAFSGLSTTVTAGSSKIQPVLAASSEPEVYVVTGINDRNEESAVSEEFSILNNLLAQGSYNDVSWTAVPGAKRYIIYKKILGLFGIIGTVEAPTVTFRDEDIAPDATKTSPILDESLRRVMAVTFDATNDYVLWEDHKLPAGSPVIFQSSKNLPALIEDYKTYFVLNPEKDSFQISATLGGIIPIVIAAPSVAKERHEAIAGLFPTSVAYFEQRRIFAGSVIEAQRVSMTASGTESDMHFSIPTVDSNRIAFDVASREAGGLRHVAPLNQLMLLSSATEYRVTSINDDALTPTSVSIRPQSFVGASLVHPAIVNNTALFAADRGGHVREMGFDRDVLSYLTGDLSLRATHLFDGLTIKDMAYSKAPNPLVWCVSSDGKLLSISYLPEESIAAWSRHITGTDQDFVDGKFETCASVAEGTEDHLYVIVQRVLAGGTVRYVERMENLAAPAALADEFFVDAGATYSGASTTSITGLDHLASEPVKVLADGLVVSGLTVSAAGVLTLTTAATKVQIGLGYIPELETLPISLQIQAWGRGTPKNVSQATVRTIGSGQFQIGPDASNLKTSKKPAAGARQDGTEKVLLTPAWQADGTIILRQTDPLPLTVTSITYEVEYGG